MILNIPSKFLLLAHHPEKGRFLISETHLRYGIIGAALLELSQLEQIKIEKGKLILLKGANSEDPVISEISREIHNSSKPRRIRYWITRLSRSSRKFKWSILSGLERGKLVRIETQKFLGIIPYRRSYLLGSNPRSTTIHHLKNGALLSRKPDEETVALLGLVEACKMHKILASDRQEMRKLKRELKQVLKESPIADAVDQTARQVQAAIIASVAATTAATAAAGSR